MHLRKRHKFMLGGFGFLVIVFIIVNSIFTYTLFVKQGLYFTLLNQRIDELKTDTQSKINSITISVLKTENELRSLGSQLGSIDEEISLLKNAASEDFSGVIEKVIRSVVTIRTDVSQGSGFIIDEKGYVVTNAHIMKGAKAASVITYEGEIHGVNMIGEDSTMDLALLKIEGDFTKLELANSDNVQLGEKVIAIGNPLGLQFTVTEGIVSAVKRRGMNNLNAYIQTDAALNPGNSGGPLINKQGQAIGINNFKVGGGESLGFALESNYIRKSVNGIFEESYGENLL